MCSRQNGFNYFGLSQKCLSPLIIAAFTILCLYLCQIEAIDISLGEHIKPLPNNFIKTILQNNLRESKRIVLLYDQGITGSEIDYMVTSMTFNGSRVISVGQLEPNPKDPWTISDYDSVRKIKGFSEANTVTNIEQDNKAELAMPVSKYWSQREVIIVLTGRKFPFTSIFDFLPDFPMEDPTPSDPLSYLLERLLQLMVTLERRRFSYFIFWNRHTPKYSVLQHPQVFGLAYKMSITSVGNQHSSMRIHGMCFACNNGRPLVYSSHYFNAERDRLYPTVELFPNNAVKMYGKQLIMSGGNFDLYQRIVPTSDPNVQKFEGGSWVKLINDLAAHINFTYELHFNPAFGFKRRNGSFAGCLADVYYGRSDMLAFIGITEYTSQGGDLTYSYLKLPFSFVTALPKVILDWTTPYKPFDPDTWMLLLAFTFVLTITLRIIVWHIAKPHFHHIWTVTHESGRQVLELPSFAILNQLNKFPVLRAIRPIAICWLFFSLVIIILFNSNLMSFYINPRKEETLDSLEALYDAYTTRGYRIAYVTYYGAGYDGFSNAKDGIYKKIFDVWDLRFDNKKCLEDVVSSRNLACISFTDGLIPFMKGYFLDSYGRSILHYSPNEFMQLGGGLGFRLEFPYMPAIEKTILKLSDSGIWGHYYQNEIEEFFVQGLRRAKERLINGTSMFAEIEGPIAISLDHVFGSFIVLGFSSMICCVMFIAEHVCHSVFKLLQASEERHIRQKQTKQMFINYW